MIMISSSVARPRDFTQDLGILLVISARVFFSIWRKPREQKFLGIFDFFHSEPVKLVLNQLIWDFFC